MARIPEVIVSPSRHPSGSRRELNVEELRQLATWMDSLFVIPGLRMRFGLDAILGLIPGLGDLATSAVSLYILKAARDQGVSRVTMARMGLNILVDYFVGMIPFAGDLFDFAWKSNLKNVALLEQHLATNPDQSRRMRWTEWLIFGGIIAMMIAMLVGSLTIAWFTLSWLYRAITGA